MFGPERRVGLGNNPYIPGFHGGRWRPLSPSSSSSMDPSVDIISPSREPQQSGHDHGAEERNRHLTHHRKSPPLSSSSPHGPTTNTRAKGSPPPAPYISRRLLLAPVTRRAAKRGRRKGCRPCRCLSSSQPLREPSPSQEPWVPRMPSSSSSAPGSPTSPSGGPRER